MEPGQVNSRPLALTWLWSSRHLTEFSRLFGFCAELQATRLWLTGKEHNYHEDSSPFDAGPSFPFTLESNSAES